MLVQQYLNETAPILLILKGRWRGEPQKVLSYLEENNLHFEESQHEKEGLKMINTKKCKNENKKKETYNILILISSYKFNLHNRK